MNSQERSFERVNQKRRTRAELLRAAREILEKGGRPSVAEAADQAGISRATAYRYFSTPEDMINEAALDGVATAIHIAPSRADMDTTEVGERVDKLVGDVFSMIADNETVFRALYGGASSGRSENRRAGRRIGWLNEAMAPIREKLPPEHFKRLVNALSLTMGIEALVVMRDVCELELEEAEKVLRWTAQALMRAALQEDGVSDR
ncbi:TetR/AcrR family transcriptional regulator [Rhizobium alvei]|uniref:TetR/AcrR family transcriptional regulator n=1 Tax=Rhizobium alvei TaxID=1132659 RepID=A0ABT8YS61_9HYPH|nr:TetR/AcrR family transcriptional regulator [Rhizobium alvei]MDO6966010.1 TetR/AcrR family transcriptional regulator [Rhizobium alvei]